MCYSVARHLDEDKIPDRILNEAVLRFDDAPVPEEKSVLEQLKENTKVSAAGQGINPDGSIRLPTEIKITGHFTF